MSQRDVVVADRPRSLDQGRRLALVIGIDDYEHYPPLSGCVADAREMRRVLERNDDGSTNYLCRLRTSTEGATLTRRELLLELHRLFESGADDVVFYFSGHGALTRTGGVLLTQEADSDDPGLAMSEVIAQATTSSARSVLLVLDCCNSGAIGNAIAGRASEDIPSHAQLRDGLTILAASRSGEGSAEIDGQGVFTRLVVSALEGGAADVRGRVSAASTYAYVEQALGSWNQRPVYKSHADRLPPVRYCRPAVSDEILLKLPAWFRKEDAVFYLAPTYEETSPAARPEHVAIFKQLKVLRDARLLQAEHDLYKTAMESYGVRLSSLGRFYWALAKTGGLETRI